MIKKKSFFSPRANVFYLKQIWLRKSQSGAAATVLSGFLAGMHWDPRQNPGEPQLTSALCPISSLLVTRVHYCSCSRGHTHSACLGVEFILDKCFVWLAVLKKKKKKVCHWHSKLDFIENLLCPVFLENFKSGKASQLGNICRAEKRLP